VIVTSLDSMLLLSAVKCTCAATNCFSAVLSLL
jgi:hypothetical protein